MRRTERELNVVLIAPGGMLGRAWTQLLQARGIEHRALGRPALDLSDLESLEQAFDGKPTHVINCGAYTDVDGAEEHEAAATRINGEAVGVLADHSHHADATLVHYSTDYVFSGRSQTPYTTTAARAPINAYGRSKAAGERAIEASKCRHLLMRTSWVYASWGQNFVLTMARLSAQRDQLSVVDDQRGRPTSAVYLAQRSLDLILAGAEGMYHVTDGGECTKFELTCELVRMLNRRCDVRPCTSDAFPTPAKRPAYSVLDLTATEDLIGVSTAWQSNLADVLARLPATSNDA